MIAKNKLISRNSPQAHPSQDVISQSQITCTEVAFLLQIKKKWLLNGGEICVMSVTYSHFTFIQFEEKHPQEP